VCTGPGGGKAAGAEPLDRCVLIAFDEKDHARALV
jgi:hypothetical protein